MLKDFRSSPLWLIGLFVIFAEGVATVAAVQLSGSSQDLLVKFVISYASIVTLVFFGFLRFKPGNLYSPSDYGNISPQEFNNALRGSVPQPVQDAFKNLSEDPSSQNKRFRLLSNLLPEEVKQHLVLMKRNNTSIDISGISEYRLTHRYEILKRDGGISVGIFSPSKFLKALDGTDTVILTGDQKEIRLLPDGDSFAEWLIDNRLDAESFRSDIGGWGERDVQQALKQQIEKFSKQQENLS
ncbi:hypothetical protein DOP62_14325 (plasmid) [Synechococcus elongatus PCC 11801]|uniref:Uncharacterized protein n=1 Tax=Synechococcus elongatus PCC 11801 TaxID=2219813 RepID=A0ACD5A334_SYNEL